MVKDMVSRNFLNLRVVPNWVYVCILSYVLFSLLLACECDSTGSYSSICEPVGGECKCKPNVIGRKCDYCAPGTYGFGPEGCKGAFQSLHMCN